MPLRQREFHRIAKLEERGCGIFNGFSMERASNKLKVGKIGSKWCLRVIGGMDCAQ